MVYTTLQEPSRNDSVSVGTSSVTVSEARNSDNPRKVIVVRNNSTAAADIIYISMGSAQAVANKGIVLRQYEVFTDAADGLYQPFQGTINAICATANGSLTVFER